MFIEVPNENFEEELRRKREKLYSENSPSQQRQVDMIYYYELSIESNVSFIPSILTTFYSTSESLLKQHRENRIRQVLSGPETGIRIFRESANSIRWEIPLGGGVVRYVFSDIQQRVRPSEFEPHRGLDFVGEFSGRF